MSYNVTSVHCMYLSVHSITLDYLPLVEIQYIEMSGTVSCTVHFPSLTVIVNGCVATGISSPLAM